MKKVDIMAIGIHPDDVELSCSGTLLVHHALGKSFGILDLSRGELGTRGNASTRTTEAMEAARILGATFRHQLDLPDGLFANTPEHWLPVVRALRACQPQIVLCNAPDDRHPDHGRAARLTLDACFYAGLEKIRTEDDNGHPQTNWRPTAVYHYIQDKQLTPDLVVDISPFINRKMQAIRAFKSQFYDPDSLEPETPISSSAFMDFMLAKNQVFGRPIQAAYAEGFLCARTPGVYNLFNLY
jgi:bacillithiol biosynthesis deacetylase BshB1